MNEPIIRPACTAIPSSIVGRASAALRARLRRRRGSVLILVVALLVLLALIGTAFITSSSSDRQATVQFGYNNQVDLLVEGVKQMVQGQILDKVAPTGAGNGSFRPALLSIDPPKAQVVSEVPNTFTNTDFVRWDAYLADRYPVLAGTTPQWNYVTASPLAVTRGNAATPKNFDLFPGQFRSPRVADNSANPKIVSTFDTRFALIPTSMQIKLPNGVTRNHPAFLINDAADTAAAGKVILAGDADGDGIADAGLFELPIGQINGVQYYAAVRVIDNTAAINLSTAWKNVPTAELTAGTDNTGYANIFPSNIELERLVTAADTAAAFTNFNTERFGGQTSASVIPILDDQTAAPDFHFWRDYDAFWTMLGSRLDNPGYNTAGNKYRGLGLGESAAMAYRFCLANPLGSQSAAERYFPNSTRREDDGSGNTPGGVNRQPFLPGDAAKWFSNIFSYDTMSAANVPIRPLVVGHNAVSNFVQSFVLGGEAGEEKNSTATIDLAKAEDKRAGQYQYRGLWLSTNAYHPGDWVRWTVGGTERSYVAFAQSNNLQTQFSCEPGTVGGDTCWAVAPWTTNPVKVNANTSSFGLLAAAYGAVMADGPNQKPAGTQELNYGAASVWTFGNPIRRSTAAVLSLTPRQVKQLRAAQAAVNTIDLRDSDDDVTSRTIILRDDTVASSTPIQATVYGCEKQPYISEAMVHTNLGKGSAPYVVIELFNPYPVVLNLDSFVLARRDVASPNAPTKVKELTGTIQPYSYAYYETSTAGRPDVTMSHYTPPTNTVTEEPKLAEVLQGNQELLLLRKRAMSGTPTRGLAPIAPALYYPPNSFSEDGDNYIDYVPCDQLDFTSTGPSLLTHTQRMTGGAAPVPEDVATRFHYRRATARDAGSGTDPWHCVYGGIYYVGVGGPITPPAPSGESQQGERRQRGWVKDRWPAATVDATDESLMTDCGFGDKIRILADPSHNSYMPPNWTTSPTQASCKVATYRTRSLPLNSEGMPGPWKAGSASATPPKMPFGGFARTGDLLAVTYVGRYRLVDASDNDPTHWPIVSGEMNSASVDSAFAEDGDLSDDIESATGNPPLEQLGRFCPIYGYGSINDLDVDPTSWSVNANHRYAWAKDLFDYLTVMCPQDDFLPNVDAGPDLTVQGAGAKWSKYPVPGIPNGLAVTTVAAANQGNEDAAAIHGLININTANAQVLSCVPFIDDTANPVVGHTGQNYAIGQAIVAYREANGPFRNLFDLLKVPGFRDKMGAVNVLSPQLLEGDITPLPANGGVSDDFTRGDFESRYLMINRVSNMLTVRSDSFTAYVLVQGWRNAGTSTPELVVQRRAAMIVDRSTVRPNRAASVGANLAVTPMSTTNVPNN